MAWELRSVLWEEKLDLVHRRVQRPTDMLWGRARLTVRSWGGSSSTIREDRWSGVKVTPGPMGASHQQQEKTTEQWITATLGDLQWQLFYSYHCGSGGSLESGRCPLLRASDLQFPRLQSDGGCTWSQFLRWLLANTASGAFCQNTPLCVARLPHHMASGFQEWGGAQALPRLLKAWASPTDLLFVGQAVSETRFQERGSKAPPLGGGGSKDLGVTLKNGTLPFLSVKCLSWVPYLILTTIKIRTRRIRKWDSGKPSDLPKVTQHSSCKAWVLNYYSVGFSMPGERGVFTGLRPEWVGRLSSG